MKRRRVLSVWLRTKQKVLEALLLAVHKLESTILVIGHVIASALFWTRSKLAYTLLELKGETAFALLWIKTGISSTLLKIRRGSLSVLLWGVSICYPIYTGMFNGPLQRALEQLGYGPFIFAVAIAQHVGFILGSLLEGILEKRFRPAAILTGAAWILSGCMVGYILLFTLGGNQGSLFILAILLPIRLAEGVSAIIVSTAAYFVFKKYHEQSLKGVLAIRNAVLWFVFPIASSVSFNIMDRLGISLWIVITSGVTFFMAMLSTGLRLIWRDQKKDSNIETNEKSGDDDLKDDSPIAKRVIFTFMLTLIAPIWTMDGLLVVFMPGYVSDLYPSNEVPFIMSLLLFSQTGGAVAGSLLSGKIPSKRETQYTVFGYILTCVGPAILAIAALAKDQTIFWVPVSSVLLSAGTAVAGFGLTIADNMVMVQLQGLRQSLGSQEGMRGLAVELSNSLAMLVLGGLVVNLLGHQTMWGIVAVLPVVSLIVLHRWLAFIEQHRPKEGPIEG